MLNVRAVRQAGLADQFHPHHATSEARKIHQYNDLLKNYQPFDFCG
ncbi:MAG: hypothetical protein K2X82_22460 [Gemmataceae bacterium]|nr:hypothetical protein [Gemmataceae bacterium]